MGEIVDGQKNENQMSEKMMFEELINQYGFKRINRNDDEDSVNSVYYFDYERLDMYVIKKSKKKKYIVYFKASERAVASKICECSSEKEAYSFLLKIIRKGNSDGSV